MSETNSFIKQTIKAICTAVIITLVAIFIFGLIVKFAELNQTVIRIINQFIKTVAIFSGCYFAFSKNKGYFKGGIAGFFATLITYFIFMIMTGSVGTVSAFMLDLLFGTLIGVISGVLTVNVRVKNA